LVIKKRDKINLKQLKQKLLPILKQHQVCRAGLFGSFVTGDVHPSSDIDLLVEFRGEKSLLDLVALKLDLEIAAKREVDVLTYQSINPLIRARVLGQEVKVL
jgi:predicted nucleotidyltransferase